LSLFPFLPAYPLPSKTLRAAHEVISRCKQVLLATKIIYNMVLCTAVQVTECHNDTVTRAFSLAQSHGTVLSVTLVR
jgi:hypothetical protein